MKQLFKALEDKDNILITGGAGVGKTYYTNKIIENLQNKKVKFAVCAMTGLASQHLSFGITLHRFLQTGRATNAKMFDELLDSHFFIENLNSISHVETIIVDEVSMMRTDYMELMDLILKKARQLRNISIQKIFDPSEMMPFGNYQLIFVGDFCQLPPVIKEGEKVKHKWIFQHPLFKEAKFRVYNLKDVKRTTDTQFIEALNKIRLGYCDETTKDLINSRASAKLNAEGTVLMSKVNGVNLYNQERLKHHQGERISLKGNFSLREEIKSKPQNEKTIKRLYKLAIDESGLEKEIELRVGCRVMILANNPMMNYSNGSQGIVLGTKFIDEFNNTFTSKKGFKYDLDYRYFGECLHLLLDSEDDVLVPKKAFPIYSSKFDDKGKRIIDLTYYQFPISLGYAVSVHKAQGMSLHNMILDCSNIFADGQFYVGLSRATNLDGISILNFEPSHVSSDQDAIDFYYNISALNQGDIYV